MVVRLIYYLLCLCVVFSQHSTLTRVYICVFCDSRWGLSAKLPCPALLSYIFAPTAGCHWCDFCLPCVSVHIYPRPFVTRLASLACSRRPNTLTCAHVSPSSHDHHYSHFLGHTSYMHFVDILLTIRHHSCLCTDICLSTCLLLCELAYVPHQTYPPPSLPIRAIPWAFACTCWHHESCFVFLSVMT